MIQSADSKNSADNLDKYVTTVMDFISECMEVCVPKKAICVFPRRKPGMNQEIHCQPKTRRAAFKLDDTDLYRKSTYEFRKARDAKRQYRTRSVFPRVNPRKMTSPDGVPSHALKSCVDRLAEVFADIFNLSLLQAKVPTCFKKSTIIPVPKENMCN
eukprot:g34994.t1